MHHYKMLSTAKTEVNLKLNKVPTMYKRECYWVYGKSGLGKSYSVRSKFDVIFEKPQNKWWDGYNGEDVVLLDDFDCPVLSHFLKIWADNYGFNAEIKGATIRPGYKKLIVTSQYFPNQLWKKEEEQPIVDAIERRFKMCTVSGEFPDYDIVDYITNEKIF